MQALANRVGNALKARGVGVEDRVLIGLSDSRRVRRRLLRRRSRSGAVVAMVNPELPDGDYEHYLEYTRARASSASWRWAAHRLRACAAELLRTAHHLRGVAAAGG